MRSLRYTTMMAAAALAWTACTSDEDGAWDGYATDPDAVVVSASVGAPQTRTNSEGDGDRFLEGDIIYVKNWGGVAGKDESCYRLLSDGTWAPCDRSGQLNPAQYLVWGNNGSNDFTAIYPAPADADNSFTLPLDQSSLDSLRLADYMTGVPAAGTDATSKPADRRLSLAFSHLLAKLTVKLVFNDQYTGLETISDVRFYLTYGTTSVLAYAHEVTDATATRPAYTALLYPFAYTDAAQTFCTLRVDGQELTVKVPAGGLTLTSGKAHTLTLHVGKNGLRMGTMTVTEWGNTVELEDNVAEEWVQPAGPDAATLTIRTEAEGEIAAHPEWIAEAVGTGTSLTIVGPMNADDLAAIKTYLVGLSDTVIDLDLSDAGLTAIPDKAFQNVTSLGQVSLPVTLTGIGRYAFSYGSSFTITNWDQLVSLEKIEWGAFMVLSSGSGLNGDIVLPESIMSIEEQAFYGTSITSIVIPSGVTAINGHLFYGCSSLKKVVCKGPVSWFGMAPFSNCSALEEVDLSACTDVPVLFSSYNPPFVGLSAEKISQIKLIVDKDLVSAFEADSYWSKCNVVAAE